MFVGSLNRQAAGLLFAEAAIVAAPHEVKGETPLAFVVFEEVADVTEESCGCFSLERPPMYAHSRRIFFVDELLQSPIQKIHRFKLREDLENRLGGPHERTDEELSVGRPGTPNSGPPSIHRA